MQTPLRETGIVLIVIAFALCLTGCAEDKALKKRQAQAKMDLGKSFLADGNSTAGLNELLRAAEMDPSNPDIHNELALAYREVGMYSEAITHGNKAIELRPNFSEAYNNLGTFYLMLGKWDLAIQCFARALDNTVYATPHFAYNNLGFAYHKKGDFRKAVASYLKAIQARPSFSRAHHNLGITYEAMKQWDDAVKAYKESIRYAPDNPVSHLSLGKLYLKIDKPSLASEEFQETIRLNKGNTFAPEARRLLKKVQ